MNRIHMVDVIGQYQKIKSEVDAKIDEVIKSGAFINGPEVKSFKANLESYLGVNHVIPCANGTDALQIALMALGLKPGDEVIVPSFTYVATAEVIALLGLIPKMIDVDPDTYNITAKLVREAIGPKTKAIVPVHLFGQSSPMEDIMEVADEHNLFVVEDNAQAIGADYTFKNGSKKKTGTIGHIGCTSFYPSKNLGCYGDGGAIFTNSDELGAKIHMIANHGQSKRYYHDIIGCNSRLDSIQAAVLNIKLKNLDHYCEERRKVADHYDEAFANLDDIVTPKRDPRSTHVFHQYTFKVRDSKTREKLQAHLSEHNIPSMIYYPVPLQDQKAFAHMHDGRQLPETDELCDRVMSLPIHTEMDDLTKNIISSAVLSFYE